jgi:hypothetical protein
VSVGETTTSSLCNIERKVFVWEKIADSLLHSLYQSCNRTGRSGPVEDSLPAGRNNFFFTGPVWIFLNFPLFFSEKMIKKVFFFENQKLFTNVQGHFREKLSIKLSYWVKICHGVFFIFAQSTWVWRSVVQTKSNNCLAL